MNQDSSESASPRNVRSKVTKAKNDLEELFLQTTVESHQGSAKFPFMLSSSSKESLLSMHGHLRIDLLAPLLEVLPIAAYIARASDGNLIWYNEAVARLWGRHPILGGGEEKFCGAYRMYTADGALLSISDGPVAQIIAGKLSEWSGEVFFERPDGTRRYIHGEVRELRDSLGNLFGAITFAWDTTESHQAEEALRRSEERNRLILQSTRDCIQVLDLDGAMLEMNVEGQQRLGIRNISVVLGSNWLGFWAPPYRDLARKAIELAKSGGAGRFEGPLTSPSGEISWWDVALTPLRDAEGKIVQLLCVSREITQKRRAEEAIRRTEKLAAVGQLASSIAHEINNPLEAVTNLLYIIGSAPELSDNTREYVQTAQQELARVGELATQTLHFHRQQVKPESIQISEVLDSLLEVNAYRLKNQEITVLRDYRARQQLTCSANDIRQLFANLINNARDAMANGGTLKIQTRDGSHPKSGQKGVYIAISDSGSGMSPSTRQRIFEPFFTTKETTSTGLGLYISLEIAKKHSAKIWVRSRQRQSSQNNHAGTTFLIFFPV